MELEETLASADAPDELTRWATRRHLDFDQAWDLCERGDHRIWLAACGGAPIQALIEAAAATVYVAEERSTGSPAAIADALDLAVVGAEPDELLRAAEVCEHIAQGGSAGYRDISGPGTAARARAAALVVRAAEALVAGNARREASRLEHARAIGAVLGVGMQAALPRRDGPARLNVVAAAGDPAQGTFLFAVAASAQAVADVLESLERSGADRDSVGRELDAIVRGAMNDV